MATKSCLAGRGRGGSSPRLDMNCAVLKAQALAAGLEHSEFCFRLIGCGPPLSEPSYDFGVCFCAFCGER